METTVGKLKIGAPLAMGRYSVSRDADPAPIVWLKGAPNSDFITEFAVDYLPFDAMERENPSRQYYYSGNPDYTTSNLLQFLNSDQEDWYEPTHQYDAPPVRNNVNDRYRGPIKTIMGFCASSKSTKSKASRIMQGSEYVCRYTAVSAARISFRSFVRRAFVQERQKTSSKTNA